MEGVVPFKDVALLKIGKFDERVECGEASHSHEAAAAEQQLLEDGSRYCQRVAKINLADTDAAFERYFNRECSSERVKEKGKEKWEIDLGKLTLKNIIARGTYGVVYRGVFAGREVAMKLLEWGEQSRMSKAQVESARAAFRQEMAVWHNLDHPNIAKLIGASIGQSDLRIPTFGGKDGDSVHLGSDVCCVVVEYVAGGTLKDFLFRHRSGNLAFRIVMRLALELSRVLSCLHSCSIMHRDVTTENMLLDKKLHLKIADFGMTQIEAQNSIEMIGETGTLAYMAPEVLEGKPYNRKCDVYSFGICLWEIYCCDTPYSNLSFSEMSSAVVRYNLRPEIPSSCPSSLASIMIKCWHVNPNKRPDMDEVVLMLEAIDSNRGVGMIPGRQPRKGGFLLNWMFLFFQFIGGKS